MSQTAISLEGNSDQTSVPVQHVIYDTPTLDDLSDLMLIERAGFTPAEAATESAMSSRVVALPDSFIVARNPINNRVIGFCVGSVTSERYITDDLFVQSVANPKTGGMQTVLSLAVHPDWRRQGIAQEMLHRLEQQARQSQRVGITLTCLEPKIAYYEKCGYSNHGIAGSTHADEVWFNMNIDFE